MSGILLNGDVSIFLQKEEALQLSGYVFFIDDGVTYDLSGICNTAACQSASLALTNDQGLHLENLSMHALESIDQIDASLANGENQPYVVEETFPLICSSQFFNGNRVNYIYPHFDNKSVDHWLEKKVNDWILDFEQNIDPEAREYRLWMDFDLISDKVISGSMTFYSQNESLPKRESFIFDVGAGEPVALEEWIKDFEIFQIQIDEAITSEKERRLSFEPQETKEWFMEQSFSNISIRHDGLCFKSTFSPLFGERKIVVPWSIVSVHFKRFANVQKMIR